MKDLMKVASVNIDTVAAAPAEDAGSTLPEQLQHQWTPAWMAAASVGDSETLMSLYRQLKGIIRQLSVSELWDVLDSHNAAPRVRARRLLSGKKLREVLTDVKVNQLCSTTRLGGCNALHLASWKGHVDAVRTLVRNCGANVDTPDIHGRTALYDAARNGMHETVSALLNELYANSRVMSKEGMTAEQVARSLGHAKVVHEFDVVSKEGYDAWLAQARREASFGYDPHCPRPASEDPALRSPSKMGSTMHQPLIFG